MSSMQYEHSIAIVDPGQDQTTHQSLCQFRSQQVPNVPDGLCMVIAIIAIASIEYPSSGANLAGILGDAGWTQMAWWGR